MREKSCLPWHEVARVSQVPKIRSTHRCWVTRKKIWWRHETSLKFRKVRSPVWSSISPTYKNESKNWMIRIWSWEVSTSTQLRNYSWSLRTAKAPIPLRKSSMLMLNKHSHSHWDCTLGPSLQSTMTRVSKRLSQIQWLCLNMSSRRQNQI